MSRMMVAALAAARSTGRSQPSACSRSVAPMLLQTPWEQLKNGQTPPKHFPVISGSFWETKFGHIIVLENRRVCCVPFSQLCFAYSRDYLRSLWRAKQQRPLAMRLFRKIYSFHPCRTRQEPLELFGSEPN